MKKIEDEDIFNKSVNINSENDRVETENLPEQESIIRIHSNLGLLHEEDTPSYQEPSKEEDLLAQDAFNNLGRIKPVNNVSLTESFENDEPVEVNFNEQVAQRCHKKKVNFDQSPQLKKTQTYSRKNF